MIPRINLYGGPGVGKSTLAAKLYSRMKRNGANVELVREEVKQWAYEKRHIHPWDCIPIFGRQLEAEQRLLQIGVQQIITDSPLLLNVFYSQKIHGCPAHREMSDICEKFEESWPSLNFYVCRPDEDFDTSGRYQTEEAAILLDGMIESQLAAHQVQYQYIRPDFQDEIQDCLKLVENT